MPLAHIAGIPVEEAFQPVAIAVLCAAAWLSARVRRPRPAQPRRKPPSR
jgi:hypothetical protein